jgi:hypothetical protein
MTNLNVLSFLSNPVTTFVISQPLAASASLTVNFGTLDSLRNSGVAVFAYSPTLQFTSPRRTATGAFQFTLTGPPGRYAIQNSTNLANWSGAAVLTNVFGSADFTDPGISGQKFFRAASTP